jgi:hypothetical protein
MWGIYGGDDNLDIAEIRENGIQEMAAEIIDNEELAILFEECRLKEKEIDPGRGFETGVIIINMDGEVLTN